MEGRAENEMKKAYGEKSLGNKKTFNQEAMMTEILKGGGETNLAKVYFFLMLIINFVASIFYVSYLHHVSWMETEIFAGERTNKQEKAGNFCQPHHLWLCHSPKSSN